MHVLLIGIWVTVLDYNTNPTVIILVGIGNFPEMHVLFLGMWMTVSGQSHSNYTSWDLKLNEMHILFIGIWSWDWNLDEMYVLLIGIWITASDYNISPTIIILVRIGILPKCMF